MRDEGRKEKDWRREERNGGGKEGKEGRGVRGWKGRREEEKGGEERK